MEIRKESANREGGRRKNRERGGNKEIKNNERKK
jgi:hypothetical protein